MTGITTAKYIGVVGGAVLTVWSLFSRIDTTVVDHLNTVFATKEDLAKVDRKIDLVIELLNQQHK